MGVNGIADTPRAVFDRSIVNEKGIIMRFQAIQHALSIARVLRRVLGSLILCAITPLALAQTAPVFTSLAPAAGTVGVAYSHTFEASGTAPIAFSVTGALPPGLAFNRMLAARVDHTATLLASGKVLIAAGVVNVSSGGFFTSAELFDPATNTWSTAGSMAVGRGFHTATRLANGRVLVAGGMGANPPSPAPHRLASAELYDPATNTWSTVGSLAEARAHHTATLLADGKVLVAGGSSNNSNLPVNSAEIFDPATNTWNAAGSFLVERRDHEATLLPDGRVLIAGGGNNISGSLAIADLYDPATNIWSPAGSLARARSYLSLTLLASGKVLAAGGFDQLGIGTVASAELYDPATNIWSAAGSLAVGRYEHTATLLPNGQVLVAAGFGSNFLASAELYDPALNSWSATGSLATPRYFHTATALANGNVLATGGLATGNANINRAEFYDIATNTWQMPGVIFGTPTSAGNYTFSVQAANSTLPNATQSVSLLIRAAAPSLTLTGVQSRKDHGSAGTHNLPLDTSVAITGSVSVEPRVIGAGHRIVFAFSDTVTAMGSATVVNGVGQSMAANLSSSGNEVTVTLPGVPDNSRVLVTLTNVNGTAGGGVAVGFLVGDVNNSRSVNAADISGVKARSGQLTTASNFKFDLNASGTINASDISAVKARSGLTLP